jgi:hypothetical protein
MNPTFAKAIAALVPTAMLLVGSTIQLSRRKGIATVFQLLGAACLVVVVIAHLCEALNWFPGMHWGLEHSVGHYIDLVAAIGGLFVISNWISVWSTHAGSRIGIPPVNQCFWISHNTGLMSMTGVPSMASMGPIRKRFLLILRTVT